MTSVPEQGASWRRCKDRAPAVELPKAGWRRGSKPARARPAFAAAAWSSIYHLLSLLRFGQLLRLCCHHVVKRVVIPNRVGGFGIALTGIAPVIGACRG